MILAAIEGQGIFEILSQLTGLQVAIIVGAIWGLILIANAVAKQTPNKTDNQIVKAFRRLMRTLGAEPPLEDK